MEKLLLITPPFVQVNCPYPATAYLKGYLTRQGYQAEQYDLSIELINRLFSRDILLRIFDACTPEQMGKDPNLERMYGLRERYLSTIDTVMEFLRKRDGSTPPGSSTTFSATSVPLTVRNFSARSICKT